MELEEKVQLLSGERERLGQELSATSTQLGKEKAKVESILRHEEVWRGPLPAGAALQPRSTLWEWAEPVGAAAQCRGSGERVQQQPHAGSPALSSPCRPSRGC